MALRRKTSKNRRKTKRRTNKRKRSRVVKRRPRKNKKRKTRRKSNKKRRRKQKGGGGCGCSNPFVKKPFVINKGGNYLPYRPPTNRLPYGTLTRQQGGGNLFQNLGLTLPKEIYHDVTNFGSRVKNLWVGDRIKLNEYSDVTKQGIADKQMPTMEPVQYYDNFRSADKAAASNLD